MELNHTITSDLIGLQNSIETGIDFTTRNKTGRPLVRFGLDKSLDASKK